LTSSVPPVARDLPVLPEPGPSTPAGRRSARFAIAIFVLGLAAPWVVGLDGLGWGDADAQTPWTRAIDAGARARATGIREPKVLIVGGSNVLFGIDADSLAARIERPVVAYGLHAAMGIDVIAELSTDLIGEGDVVVFVPELAGFKATHLFSPSLRGDWLTSRPFSIRDPVASFPLRTWYAGRDRMRALRTRLDAWLAQALQFRRRRAPAAAVPPRPQSPYEVAAIDAAGRVAFPRPATATTVLDQSPSDRSETYDFATSRGIDAVRTLARACRARGARLLVAPGMHGLHAGGTAEYAERIRALEARWMEAAAALGAERLLEPGSTTVAQEFIYDTTHHMNERGVALLEERFAAALRAVLARPAR
jgi:hypothetical protein